MFLDIIIIVFCVKFYGILYERIANALELVVYLKRLS
jgi:hypothetical protein